MRIVAGKWRGRIIQAPKGQVVRPTRDRVREAWMSIVQFDVPDARVLDLFSGSGALGLEALSRGARHVDFVENNPESLKALRANITLLNAQESCSVYEEDAVAFVQKLNPQAYDLAFADPPYDTGAAEAVARGWLERPFASLLGVEHSSRETLPEGGRGGSTRKYGITRVTFYRCPE